MNFLDLPAEIVSQIVQQVFNSWDICILRGHYDSPNSVRCDGYPREGIDLACRLLHSEAETAIRNSFTGRLIAEGHDGHLVGTLCDSFVKDARMRNVHQLLYFLDRVHTIRYINPGQNPSLWKICTTLEFYPSLRRIELDCRYRFHFAVHSVPRMDEFLDGSDGELAKYMDFRKAFFLSCERFIARAVGNGVTVAVIRDMGVREGKGRCNAVLVAVDYIHQVPIGLKLDMTSIRTQSTPINGWPHGIRAALNTLTI